MKVHTRNKRAPQKKAPHLVCGGGLLGVLVLPVPQEAGEPDADAAVGLLRDLSDGRLVDGRLGQVGALHLPHLAVVRGARKERGPEGSVSKKGTPKKRPPARGYSSVACRIWRRRM